MTKFQIPNSKQIPNPKFQTFTHLDKKGRAMMVDVSGKEISKREAIAYGKVWMEKKTIKLLKSKRIPKGDVFTVAKIAGIQAAKRVGEIVPLCHNLLVDLVDIEFHYQLDGIKIEAIVRSTGKTGVEMEALAAVSVAALTIYDMCKAVDKKMEIGEIRLWRKSKQSV